MTEQSADAITYVLVDQYRITASLGDHHLASAVCDLYGWAIHCRKPNGRYATVARVHLADPGLARSLALTKLHRAAAARLVGAA